MPIEIKELIIKVTVDDAAAGGGKNTKGKSGGGDQQSVIEACVEKVMELLNEQNNYR